MADTETDADTALTARDETERGARRKGLGLSGLALVGVILFSVTFAGIVTAVFLLPPEHLRIPELQPAVRVAHETDFPVGASRIVAWGDEPILVVTAASCAGRSSRFGSSRRAPTSSTTSEGTSSPA
jgi:hypothetical protein